MKPSPPIKLEEIFLLKNTDISIFPLPAKNADFCIMISCSGLTLIAFILPGKDEAKAIIPSSVA